MNKTGPTQQEAFEAQQRHIADMHEALLRERFLKKEADPYGKDQHSLGAKLDAHKPDLSLLLMFGKALEQVGRVGTFGAGKYTRGGWQSVEDGETRYTAALLRHLCQEHYEDLDNDSGLLHAAHAAWNALARLELIVRNTEVNDERDHSNED